MAQWYNYCIFHYTIILYWEINICSSVWSRYNSLLLDFSMIESYKNTQDSKQKGNNKKKEFIINLDHSNNHK